MSILFISLTELLGSLYRGVAGAYDIMLDIASTSSFSAVKSFFDRVYILIGVFMLFRMVVSFLIMLVDPDKVSDQKSGVGNLLSRIVVSLVLLVSFETIFGFLDQVQQALVAPKNGSSLLWNILPESKSSLSSVPVQNGNDDDASNAYQVPKGTEDGFSCYYIPDYIAGDWGVNPSFPTFLTVHFSKNKVTSNGYYSFEVLDDGDDTISAGSPGSGWYGYINSGRSVVYGESRFNSFWGASFSANDYTRMSLGHWFSGTGSPENLDNHICPKSIDNVYCDKDSSGTYRCMPQELKSEETSLNNLVLRDDAQKGSVSAYNDGSFEGLLTFFGREVYEHDGRISNEDGYYKDVARPGEEEIVKGILENYIINNNKYSSAARIFAINLANSFVGRTIENDCDEECWTTAQKLSESPAIDSKIEELADDNKIDVSHFTGIVVGFVVIVILITICIDVVIRNCKLLLLEAIAPVAALSYIDPNDKIFSTWLKQFFGTYVDLFIKILAISLGVYFLHVLLDQISSTSMWIRPIVIMGTISFIKILPGFISKVFGISDMAGSFKDSFKILKAGAGMAIGGAIAGGAALAGGARTTWTAYKNGGWRNAVGSVGQGFGTTFGAILRGAKGGAKGKLGEGRRYAADINRRRSNLYRSGIGTRAQVVEPIVGRMGLDTVSRTDRQIQQMKEANDSYKLVSDLKDSTDNIIKSSDFYKNVIGRRDASGNSIFQSKEQKDMMGDWADLQVKYKKQIDGGNMTKSQATAAMSREFLNQHRTLLENRGVIDSRGNDTATHGAFTMDYEIGRADGVYQHFERTSALLQNNSTIKESFGQTFSSGVHTYKELKDLEGMAKNKFSSNETEIYNRTTGNSEYNVSKAVQENGEKGNKKS